MLEGAARIVIQDSSLKYQAFHCNIDLSMWHYWHVQQGMNLQNIVTACASACPEAPELDAHPCWGCAGGCVPPSPVAVSVTLLTLPAAVGLSALRYTPSSSVNNRSKAVELGSFTGQYKRSTHHPNHMGLPEIV